jgi:superfamily II DNA/RNA helicase
VYEKIVKGTGITLGNFNFNTAQKQIIVTTHGKLEPLLKGRTAIDLSDLKCLVVDEADVFFTDEKNFTSIKTIANYKQIKNRDENNKVQWILFSATYPEGAEAEYEAV